MLLGIDPKVDYAFKWLFGNQRASQRLIHLLNAILDLPAGEWITEIEILNPFNEKMGRDEKLSILDIKARDQLGRQFNIEMQMVVPIGFPQRVVYYWAKLYTEQLQTGEEYHQLKPTISVCFVNGTVFPNVQEYQSTFRLIDAAHGGVLTEDLTIHFFELPKFNLRAEELTTPLEAWLYFLRHAEQLDPENLPETLETREIQDAVEELMVLTKVDIQKEIYEGRLKAQRDALSLTNAMTRVQTQLADAEAQLADAEAQLADAEARAAEAEAEASRAAAEAMEKGVLVGRIELLQKLLRQAETPRTDLEAMPLESLAAMAGQLEQELLEENARN